MYRSTKKNKKTPIYPTPRTRSRIHVLVPAPSDKLSERHRPLLIEGWSPPPPDDALYELLAVEPFERPAQAQHLPQNQAEAVHVRLLFVDKVIFSSCFLLVFF